MSASNKKQRSEENAAKLAERKAAEQKEAKQLKLMSIAFIATLSVIVIVAAVFAGVQFVKTSGIRENKTVAVTIGGQEVSNAQLNYYYVDAVNQFVNNYGSMAAMFGFDLTKPLNEQVTNPETGATWADDFMQSAKSSAQEIFALYAAAQAAGYTLDETATANINNQMSTLELYALYNQFTDAESYVKAMYGPGASLEGYKEYVTMRETASAYANFYATSLTFDEAALRAGEEGREGEFSNFSYNYFYVNTDKFLQGGTTAEDGTTTYTDAEKAAAVKAAEAAAKALAKGKYATVEAFDAAVAAMEINAASETAVKSVSCTDYAYSNLTTIAKDWIADSSRKAGDVTSIENANETADGTKTVMGYYVIYFVESNDNNYPLVNARHILVTPEGGTYNSNTGMTDYTVEEMAAAQLKAQDLLDQFLAGKGTEDVFAIMASEHTTDTGSKENGGLYEDIYPGQMVTNFNNWVFDESRKAGDTGLVESPYGWHVMYFSGDSETLYRDFLIENALRNEAFTEWLNGLMEAAAVVDVKPNYLSTDLVVSRG